MPKKIRVNIQRDLVCVEEEDFGVKDEQERRIGARMAVIRETLTEAADGARRVPCDHPRIQFVTIVTYTRGWEPYGRSKTETFGTTEAHALGNAIRVVSEAKRRYVKMYGRGLNHG